MHQECVVCCNTKEHHKTSVGILSQLQLNSTLKSVGMFRNVWLNYRNLVLLGIVCQVIFFFFFFHLQNQFVMFSSYFQLVSVCCCVFIFGVLLYNKCNHKTNKCMKVLCKLSVILVNIYVKIAFCCYNCSMTLLHHALHEQEQI